MCVKIVFKENMKNELMLLVSKPEIDSNFWGNKLTTKRKHLSFVLFYYYLLLLCLSLYSATVLHIVLSDSLNLFESYFS